MINVYHADLPINLNQPGWTNSCPQTHQKYYDKYVPLSWCICRQTAKVVSALLGWRTVASLLRRGHNVQSQLTSLANSLLNFWQFSLKMWTSKFKLGGWWLIWNTQPHMILPKLDRWHRNLSTGGIHDFAYLVCTLQSGKWVIVEVAVILKSTYYITL